MRTLIMESMRQGSFLPYDRSLQNLCVRRIYAKATEYSAWPQTLIGSQRYLMFQVPEKSKRRQLNIRPVHLPRILSDAAVAPLYVLKAAFPNAVAIGGKFGLGVQALQ